MTDEQEQQLIRESHRGAKAAQVLKSEIFVEAFAVVEADVLEKWKSSPVRDTEGQLALRLKWQVLQEVKKHIADAAMTGKLANAQLEHERSLAERARAAVKAFKRA